MIIQKKSSSDQPDSEAVNDSNDKTEFSIEKDNQRIIC